MEKDPHSPKFQGITCTNLAQGGRANHTVHTIVHNITLPYFHLHFRNYKQSQSAVSATVGKMWHIPGG